MRLLRRRDGSCPLILRYTIRNRAGRIIRQDQRYAQSFTANYIKYLYLIMGYTGVQTFTDTGGSSRSLVGCDGFEMSATATTTTKGIVVGTGSTGVTINDTKLVTQIAHGTGAGQLQYGASVVNLPAADATGTSMICTRDFSNVSGGTITVNEAALYVQSAGGFQYKFCIARDLETQVLTDGSQMTWEYEFRTNT